MYLFLKWLHLLAIISWMAGILYFYRLLIYHRENLTDSSRCELLKLMQFRLYRYITAPAMGISILAGIGLIYKMPHLLHSWWLIIKISCVVFLIYSTSYGKKISRQLAQATPEQAENLPSSTTLRILNEVPTILMMLIVAMVVFRPFS
ncbi:MAG: CopD family protein [Oligoflexales bacterium]